MKKLMTLLFAGIVSVSAFAATTSASTSATNMATASAVTSADLVIKQTIEFGNGQPAVTIYYVKENDLYKVYSETDLSKQSPSKLKQMSKSKIELAKTYKGKCQLTCNSLKEVADLGYTLYGKYGKYVDLDKVIF